MNSFKKHFLVLMVLTLLLTLWTAVGYAVSGTVNVSSLVVREEMSTSSKALCTLPKGEDMTIVHKDGSWYKVKYGKFTGYVVARYVKADGSVPDVDEVEGLRNGSSGSKVKELQRRLKELGYYSNSIDGSFGGKTEDAVKAFQKRNGLTADGVVGDQTLKVLNSSSAKKAQDSSSSSSSSSTSDSDSLRLGDKGSEVKKLQERLKELGYYKKTIDGVYGSGTVSAIKAFQQRNGLTSDGVAGKATQNKLYSSSAKGATDSSSGSSSEDSFDDENTLRFGAKGTAIKTLQTKLKSLGYYKSTIDGVFGTGTLTAVKNFQTRNGLKADGVVGESTLKVLYSSSAKGPNDDVQDDDDGDDVVSGGDSLKAGDYGDRVRELQKRLKELGYYKNSIDGSFGTVTQKAVKAFQERNGLTVDGVAGGATLTKLNSSSAVSATGSSSSSSSSDKYETLRPGDRSDAVKEMQYRLKELGYYTNSRDGVYGSVTRAAVLAFQTRNGLTADGVAGNATLTKLYSSSAIKADTSSSGSGSGTGSGSTNVSTSDSLKPGDSGAEVKKLQQRLKELGYYTNTLDGQYGYGTRQAVIAFQKNNGLTQDGIAGPSTLKKLNSSSAVGKNDVSESKYVTERLDWFNGGASRIPRKAIFQVKDVKTGLVFTAKRQAGGFHLDAEPLTAADSAILLKINGGKEYSYRRRPMLVLYNGRVYACSIYSEPHGNDTIPGNNFDGQFCLHFYGSKTHGTDRVDADHQACEAQALKATW